MFLMRSTERAYVNYTEDDVRNSPNNAVRLTFSNSHFDPQVGSDLYHEHLDEYEYAEEVANYWRSGSVLVDGCQSHLYSSKSV